LKTVIGIIVMWFAGAAVDVHDPYVVALYHQATNLKAELVKYGPIEF